MSLTHGFWSSIYLRLLQQLTLWTRLFQTFSWSLGQCSCFSFYHLAVLNLLCRNFFFCTSLKRGCSKLVLLVNCPFSPRSSSQHEDCVGAHGAPFGGTPHLAECSAVATLRFLVIFETGPPFYLVLGPTIVYPPDCKPHEGRDGVWLAQNCLSTWHTDCLKNGWENVCEWLNHRFTSVVCSRWGDAHLPSNTVSATWRPQPTFVPFY